MSKKFVLKAKHKSKKGGLTAEGRRAYNRATGSHLKAPQPEGGSRKKSYCARSKGQMKDHNIDCSKTPDKRICLARRRWKCRKSLQKSDMPPKAKLAAFLRDHIDNKLALKAAEPKITKSGELEKAISPEQQKENIRKQRELQNRQVVSQLKGKLTPSTQSNKQKKYMIDSGSVDLYDEYYNKTGEEEGTADTESYEYQKFLKDNKHSLPYFVDFHTEDDDWAGRIEFEPHQNGKNIHITNSEFEKEHQNKGLEEAAQKIAEEHYGKPLLTSKKTQPKSVPSKPEPTPAPASSKASHLRVVKSLNADKTGMSALMKALKQCACKKSDKLAGGKGDTKDISDFDAKQVEMGLKVEMEHTKDREVAQEIVADHLSEDPSYYSKLKGSGLADELKKAISPEQQKENIRKQRELQNRQVVQTLKPQKRLGNAICLVCDSPMDSSEGMAHADCFDEFEDYDEFENFIKQKKQQEAKKPTSIPSKTSHLQVVKSLEKADRCWEGYEPTPGKKPYSKGSCRKIKKSITAEAIEAGQYQGEQLDSHHHNRLGVEYKGMAQKAHKMGDRKKAREFHDKALHHFKMADKMGFQAEEPLEKKIGGKVAAGLTALAGMMPTQFAAASGNPTQTEITAKPIPKEKYPDFNAHNAISMIESSGGKNIIHKFIPKQNQRAVSRYGLLPTRVMELYARSPEFRESPQGKMVGEILEPHLSKHKTKNFYDTAAFVQKTPKDVRGQLYQQINKITENPEHDKAIFEASRKHSMENLLSVTSDPVELEIMATHAHHWHWPRTKRLYQKGGLDAVINDEKSKEGNYIKKFHKQLPEGHPVKERIEEALPQPQPPVKKKAPFHGS